jgi:hypothetical protein
LREGGGGGGGGGGESMERPWKWMVITEGSPGFGKIIGGGELSMPAY